MPKNSRRGEENQKGDSKCYFPYKRCCSACPVRVLIATTKRHCRRSGHINRGLIE